MGEDANETRICFQWEREGREELGKDTNEEMVRWEREKERESGRDEARVGGECKEENAEMRERKGEWTMPTSGNVFN